jgi:hypothetical protein
MIFFSLIIIIIIIIIIIQFNDDDDDNNNNNNNFQFFCFLHEHNFVPCYECHYEISSDDIFNKIKVNTSYKNRPQY